MAVYLVQSVAQPHMATLSLIRGLLAVPVCSRGNLHMLSYIVPVTLLKCI